LGLPGQSLPTPTGLQHGPLYLVRSNAMAGMLTIKPNQASLRCQRMAMSELRNRISPQRDPNSSSLSSTMPLKLFGRLDALTWTMTRMMHRIIQHRIHTRPHESGAFGATVTRMHSERRDQIRTSRRGIANERKPKEISLPSRAHNTISTLGVARSPRSAQAMKTTTCGRRGDSSPGLCSDDMETLYHPKILLPVVRKIPWNIISSACGLVALSSAASLVMRFAFTRS